MSSPMYDTPRHSPIPYNSDGLGPETDPLKITGITCWCTKHECEEFPRKVMVDKAKLTAAVMNVMTDTGGKQVTLETIIEGLWKELQR